MVARLQHDPSAGGDHGMMRILQFLQRLVFLVSEERFPERGKDIRNRFSVFVADGRVGIDKAEPQRRAISLPTEDFPDPMKPTRTRLRTDSGRCIAATASTQPAATGNE